MSLTDKVGEDFLETDGDATVNQGGGIPLGKVIIKGLQIQHDNS
jgi:hypothetical protein